MFEDKTSANIHAEMLAEISDSYDKGEGEVTYEVTKPMAIEVEKVYLSMNEVVNKLSIENLTGSELETRIEERTAIVRKPATRASTVVTITGTTGSLINIGDKVASESVNFVFTEAKTIDATGIVAVNVECEQLGSIGNVPIGAIKYFPVTISGLISVTNLTVVSNGFNSESDTELKNRYYEKIRTPVTSGNKAFYKNLVNEIVGVGDNRIVPLIDGDLTFGVVIIDSNKGPASTELVDYVQSILDPYGDGLGDGLIDFGITCIVSSAIGLNINVAFTLDKDPAYTLTQVKENVDAALTEYLKSTAFIGTSVSYARISNIILDADGVIDHNSLTINGGIANIAIPSDNVAILGTITIT